MPVRVPIRGELTDPCVPNYDVSSAGALTVDDVLKRLAAVEEALAYCNGKLEQIRTIK